MSVDPFGPKVSAIVDGLRARVDAGDAPESDVAALSFIDTFLAARARCMAGRCTPRGAHLSTACAASGKSRRLPPSERPLAEAV